MKSDMFIKYLVVLVVVVTLVGLIASVSVLSPGKSQFQKSHIALSGKITEAECNDGVDNDGDDLVDYPDDTGCDSLDDTSEQQTAEQCYLTIDPETGEQTNPDCPAPAGEPASVTAVIANLHKLNSDCAFPGVPDGSIVKKGSQCFLTKDITINAAIEPNSFTHLNCNNHYISPNAAGIRDDPNTVANEYKPSSPVAGILLHESFGVKIQNCIIKGFDFGIVSVDSKVPEELKNDPGSLELLSNKILSNSITAAYQTIQLLRVDNHQISDNTLISLSGGGSAITVWRDSDMNKITGNNIKAGAGSSASEKTPQLPGGALQNFVHNDPINMFADLLAPGVGSLINFRIGDVFVQLPWQQTDLGENNLIEGNTIDAGNRIVNTCGIQVHMISSNTAIRGNTIMGAGRGISLTGIENRPITLPGVCSLDSNRWCLTNAGCFISGVDTVSKGSCTGTVTTGITKRSDNTLIENNNMMGPSTRDAIEITQTRNAKIEGNYITGAGRGGIALLNPSLETATVTRNTIVGNPFGFVFDRTGAAFFGSKIFLNDITNSGSRSITTLGPYTIATELSVDGRGNYWGHSCASDSANDLGFIEFGKPGADSPVSFIVDSHPYGQSVATTEDILLPATCS